MRKEITQNDNMTFTNKKKSYNKQMNFPWNFIEMLFQTIFLRFKTESEANEARGNTLDLDARYVASVVFIMIQT